MDNYKENSAIKAKDLVERIEEKIKTQLENLNVKRVAPKKGVMVWRNEFKDICVEKFNLITNQKLVEEVLEKKYLKSIRDDVLKNKFNGYGKLQVQILSTYDGPLLEERMAIHTTIEFYN